MIPNLNISFNSGQPNQPASYNIRGNTSLNGGSALILVDGVEVSDLSLINPQDIDNISVKATTTERLGFVGRKEGCEVWATVLIFKI